MAQTRKRSGLFSDLGPAVVLGLLTAMGCEGTAGTDSKVDAGPTRDAGMDAATGSGDSSVPGPDARADDAAEPRSDGQTPTDMDAGPDSAVAACEPFVVPADCVIPADLTLPNELRCTGLYSNASTRAIACGVLPYAPSHALWTDAAVKNRWVSLPAGATIDVTDPDEFVYPVGTQFWKEFNIQDGKGGTRLGETRLIRKVEGGWVYGTYVWNEEATNAVQVIDGVADLFGLGHTVPTRDQCNECHKGRADFVMGWDLVLLGAGATGVTLDSLTSMGALSSEGGTIASLTIPGNAVEQAALGYLHVNCGVSCHNRNNSAKGKLSGLFLRLDEGTLGSVQTTDAVVSGINNAPSTNIKPPFDASPAAGPYFDFRPLDLERSLSLARMKVRGEGQMPQIGSNVRDTAGEAIVSAWINSMTTAAGYPAPSP